MPDVHAVLDRIRLFSEAVRNGEYKGVTGRALTDVVAIGIGGSFLGPAFVHTALETDPTATVRAAGRTLSFLANVDPEDVSRALKGKDPETTLVVVVSKTFTTAETMLNARTVRQWIATKLGPAAVRTHSARHRALMLSASLTPPSQWWLCPPIWRRCLPSVWTRPTRSASGTGWGGGTA